MFTVAGRSLRVIKRVLGACAFAAILISAGCSTQAVTAPTIATTSATLAQADQNVAYNANVTATGGTAPFTWVITSGPAWLSTAAGTTSTVAILGTPTTVGAAPFTLKVTDAKGLTNTANLSIMVNAPPTITTVSGSLPAGTAGVAYSATVNATGGTAPFTWAITSGPAWLGTAVLNPTSSVTIQGTPTAGGPAIPFSIKVTDAAGGTFTAPLTLNIAPPAALAITTTQLQVVDGSIAVPYPLTAFAATGGVPPYTWSNPSGDLPPGLTLSPAGVISGTPTATQNNLPISVDIKVADSFGTPPVTNNFNITIGIAAVNPCGPSLGNEAVLKGQYAFLVQGYDGTGSPIALVTSFNADGTGNVAAGGDADFTDSTGSINVTFTSASSYVVGPDNRGCVALVASGGAGTAVFRFALGGVTAGVATKGSIIEFDDASGTSTRASGVIRLQTPADFVASHMQANYAFGMDGLDMAGGHYAVGGSFSLSNTTGVISSLFSDIDDAGVITAPGGLTAGVGGNGLLTLSSAAPVSPSASTGRMLGSLSPDANHTYGLAIYMVNASEFFAITTDTLSATQPILSGKFIVTGAGFTNASAASTEMIHVNGTSVASGGSASGTIGILTFANGTPGTVNGNLYNSDGTTQPVAGGTYTVDPASGRVALAGVGGNPPSVYLAGSIDGVSAFIIGSDTSAIFGYAEVQNPPAGPYNAASVTGTYTFGIDQMIDNAVTNVSGSETIASGVISSDVVDFSNQGGLTINFSLPADLPNTPSFNINADGSGKWSGFGSATTFVVTNGTKVFILDDTSGVGEIIVLEK